MTNSCCLRGSWRICLQIGDGPNAVNFKSGTDHGKFVTLNEISLLKGQKIVLARAFWPSFIEGICRPRMPGGADRRLGRADSEH